MLPEKEWGKIFFCHSCKKYLDDEIEMTSHILLGHQANSFISMPVDAGNRIAKKLEEREIEKQMTLDRAEQEYLEPKEDYAESLEVEDERTKP